MWAMLGCREVDVTVQPTKIREAMIHALMWHSRICEETVNRYDQFGTAKYQMDMGV